MPVTLLFNIFIRRFEIPFFILSLIIIKIDGLKFVFIIFNQIDFYSVLKNIIKNNKKKILKRKEKDNIGFAVNVRLNTREINIKVNVFINTIPFVLDAARL